MSAKKPHIAIVAGNDIPESWKQSLTEKFELEFFNNGFEFVNQNPGKGKFKVLISFGGYQSVNGLPLHQGLMDLNIPFVFVADKLPDSRQALKLLKLGVSEVFDLAMPGNLVADKVFLLSTLNISRGETEKWSHDKFKYPLGKRVFDIMLSLMLLTFLAPFLLLIAIIIKLESKGPIFYISKRVGTGYKVFDFYKFRTMYSDADKRLEQLSSLNQYKAKPGMDIPPVQQRCKECEMLNKSCEQVLYLDRSVICEKLFMVHNADQEPAFIKFANDPRITKFGKILRNTSLDELPQFFNVLKGDMSFVGNRPLPLYEAEKLTTDQFTLRFMAPAGITGLWQVSKRGGKGEMSHEERIELDNEYARNLSLIKDVQILLKTVPAMFQRENV